MLNISFAFAFFRNIRSIRKLTYKTFIDFIINIIFFFSFQCVQMAHALRRISYATCEPQHAQFSFLAREPRAHFSIQYCHSFITESAEQVSGYFSFFQPRLNEFSFYETAIIISYKNYTKIIVFPPYQIGRVLVQEKKERKK